MKILVLNCGSSSLKYEVFRMPERESMGKGLIERIGTDGSFLSQSTPCGELKIEAPMSDHGVAMHFLSKALVDTDKGILRSADEIDAIGHRVVHGGEHFSRSVIIDDSVLSAIQANIPLAPLHNPANLIGIREAMKGLPGKPNVAVFDTAFHQTMPPEAYLYGLPRELYDTYKIRRYGFHGTSHRYVAERALTLMKRDASNTCLITCHLGNGASITAVENGKSIDTSMGMTPLEGLVMGTRCGDIDPAIIGFLEDRGMSCKDIMTMLNKKSGVLGLSGISNDMRDLEAAAARADKKALETLNVYAHRVRRYIGAYAAGLPRVDGIVFTGGIGENDAAMRERICRRLEHIGIVMDYGQNASMGRKEGIVSMPWSTSAILVVPTNEELQIAIDVADIVQ